LRRIALNTLNREQSFQRSTRQKSNRAAMDNNYMLKILACFNLTMTLNPLVNEMRLPCYESCVVRLAIHVARQTWVNLWMDVRM